MNRPHAEDGVSRLMASVMSTITRPLPSMSVSGPKVFTARPCRALSKSGAKTPSSASVKPTPAGGEASWYTSEFAPT